MSAAQNRKLPKLIIVLLMIAVVAVSLIMAVVNRGAPTTERANLSDYYRAEDGSAAIVVNGTLSSVRAVIKDAQPYIRLGLLTGEINRDFYYETSSSRLLYTSADGVTAATADQVHNGAPVFFDAAEPGSGQSADERIYVLLSYIAQFTNIKVDYFNSPARVFIRSRFGKEDIGTAGPDASLRTEASGSGAVLYEPEEGEELWLVSSENGWSLAYAASGFAGYIPDGELSGRTTRDDPGPYQAPEYTRTLKDGRICLVWHQVFNDSGVGNLEKLLDRTSGMNVLAPTWFSVVDSNGTIESRANSDYVDIAKARGLDIWALVENFNTDSKLDYSVLFGTEAARTRMVETLVNEVIRYRLDGINVDFEGLPAEAGTGYIQFIRELSAACRKKGITLSVDCYVPSAWTAHYHRDQLAKLVDYIIVMAYDEHYDGSDPGSTSSLPFLSDGIEKTVAAGVPAERLIPAIPFYSRLWKGEGITLRSSTIHMEDMKTILHDHEDAAVWDDTLGQYYVEFTSDGEINRLWVEDGRSLAGKLALISRYDTAGVACWKLGTENAEAWEAIAENFE